MSLQHPLQADLTFVERLYTQVNQEGTDDKRAIDSLLPQTDRPEQYFDEANKLVLDIFNRAATEGNSMNARIILNALRNSAKQFGGMIPYTNIITVANTLITQFNAQGGLSPNGGGEKVQFKPLSPNTVGDYSEAVYRILFTIYHADSATNKTYYEQDMALAEIIDSVVQKGLELKNEQKVLTIGDLIMRFPEANAQQLQQLMNKMQRGNDVNSVHRWYRELNQQTQGKSRWSWKRSGYGGSS